MINKDSQIYYMYDKIYFVGTVVPLRKWVLPMYVTYENLFLFVTMLTGVIALVIGIKHKK